MHRNTRRWAAAGALAAAAVTLAACTSTIEGTAYPVGHGGTPTTGSPSGPSPSGPHTDVPNAAFLCDRLEQQFDNGGTFVEMLGGLTVLMVVLEWAEESGVNILDAMNLGPEFDEALAYECPAVRDRVLRVTGSDSIADLLSAE